MDIRESYDSATEGYAEHLATPVLAYEPAPGEDVS